MTKYFTKTESIEIDQALNQMTQAIVSRLLHFNGRNGKVGTQWKTDPIEKLNRSFSRHATNYAASVANLDGIAAREDDLVDALAMGMMLFDRIQMLKEANAHSAGIEHFEDAYRSEEEVVFKEV